MAVVSEYGKSHHREAGDVNGPGGHKEDENDGHTR